MHPEDIKAAIRKAGKTQRAVAVGLGVSAMAVSHVINGRQKSQRVAAAISSVTGMPVSTLWPGKYLQLEALQRTAKQKAPAAPAAQPRRHKAAA